MAGITYVRCCKDDQVQKKIQGRFIYRFTKLFIASEADAGAVAKEMITNKKQTAAAIKAAVDQAEKVKKIKRKNEIRNEEEFNTLKDWVTKKEKQWLK